MLQELIGVAALTFRNDIKFLRVRQYSQTAMSAHTAASFGGKLQQQIRSNGERWHGNEVNACRGEIVSEPSKDALHSRGPPISNLHFLEDPDAARAPRAVTLGRMWRHRKARDDFLRRGEKKGKKRREREREGEIEEEFSRCAPLPAWCLYYGYNTSATIACNGRCNNTEPRRKSPLSRVKSTIAHCVETTAVECEWNQRWGSTDEGINE